MHMLLTEKYGCDQESYEEVQRECSADWVSLYHQRCCEVCIRANCFVLKHLIPRAIKGGSGE